MSEKITLEHNGIHGAYEQDGNCYKGRLTSVDKEVTFEGEDEDAVNQAFIDAVYDYQEGKV